MNQLIAFSTSKYIIPLVIFAYIQAVSFWINNIKLAADDPRIGNSNYFSFLRNLRSTHLADKITTPVIIILPIYLFNIIGGVNAIILWASTLLLSFIFAVGINRIPIYKANLHIVSSIFYAVATYCLVSYWTHSIWVALSIFSLVFIMPRNYSTVKV